MAKIIVAFPDKDVCRKIAGALESEGLEVFRSCMTGNEVMRAFTQCQDGLLICAVRFPDRTADALAWDLGDRAVVLVVGHPDQLDLCEHPDIFRQPLPFNRSELLSAVRMLLQLHDHRMPKRKPSQQSVIMEAKSLLMTAAGLTEPEAHRALQRYSMQHGEPMASCAKKITQGELTLRDLL